MNPLSVVYVLSNPAMPGMLKIGRTSHQDAHQRIGQLYTTGVPVPFKLEYACKVSNPEEVESAMHIAFAPYRVNPKREFFQIEAPQAIAILKLLHTEDATGEVEAAPSGVDEQSIKAGQQLKEKRPPLNFLEMGIPLQSVLYSTKQDITVTVCAAKKVMFNGEQTSLTAATRTVLGLEYSVAPGPYWTYEGKLLRDIYYETYTETE